MSMRVLIADPDWRFARQASAYLESHAHMVVRCSNGEQVLDMASRWSPDLVMVSERLTEGGLLEELHAMEDRPAVLLIGRMDRYDRVWRAWQRGGDELLMKPVFRSRELHAAVVAALENAVSGAREQRLAVSA